MRSFFRGDLWAVVEALDGGNQKALDFVEALLESGLLHALDKFDGFRDFESGRVKLRIHPCSPSVSERYVLSAAVSISKWGVGEYPSPTSRAEPKATPPEPDSYQVDRPWPR